MLGLRVENDAGRKILLPTAHTRSYRFANQLADRFHTTGFSGSMKKHDIVKKHQSDHEKKERHMYISSDGLKTSTQYKIEMKDKEIQEDAARLEALEKQLAELRRQKEARKQRQEARRIQKLQYCAAIKIQKVFRSYMTRLKVAGAIVMTSFLKTVRVKNCISKFMKAIATIHRFVQKKYILRKKEEELRKLINLNAMVEWQVISDEVTKLVASRKVAAEKCVDDMISTTIDKVTPVLVKQAKRNLIKIELSRQAQLRKKKNTLPDSPGNNSVSSHMSVDKDRHCAHSPDKSVHSIHSIKHDNSLKLNTPSRNEKHDHHTPNRHHSLQLNAGVGAKQKKVSNSRKTMVLVKEVDKAALSHRSDNNKPTVNNVDNDMDEEKKRKLEELHQQNLEIMERERMKRLELVEEAKRKREAEIRQQKLLEEKENVEKERRKTEFMLKLKAEQIQAARVANMEREKKLATEKERLLLLEMERKQALRERKLMFAEDVRLEQILENARRKHSLKKPVAMFAQMAPAAAHSELRGTINSQNNNDQDRAEELQKLKKEKEEAGLAAARRRVEAKRAAELEKRAKEEQEKLQRKQELDIIAKKAEELFKKQQKKKEIKRSQSSNGEGMIAGNKQALDYQKQIETKRTHSGSAPADLTKALDGDFDPLGDFDSLAPSHTQSSSTKKSESTLFPPIVSIKQQEPLPEVSSKDNSPVKLPEIPHPNPSPAIKEQQLQRPSEERDREVLKKAMSMNSIGGTKPQKLKKLASAISFSRAASVYGQSVFPHKASSKKAKELIVEKEEKEHPQPLNVQVEAPKSKALEHMLVRALSMKTMETPSLNKYDALSTQLSDFKFPEAPKIPESIPIRPKTGEKLSTKTTSKKNLNSTNSKVGIPSAADSLSQIAPEKKEKVKKKDNLPDFKKQKSMETIPVDRTASKSKQEEVEEHKDDDILHQYFKLKSQKRSEVVEEKKLPEDDLHIYIPAKSDYESSFRELFPSIYRGDDDVEGAGMLPYDDGQMEYVDYLNEDDEDDDYDDEDDEEKALNEECEKLRAMLEFKIAESNSRGASGAAGNMMHADHFEHDEYKNHDEHYDYMNGQGEYENDEEDISDDELLY